MSAETEKIAGAALAYGYSKILALSFADAVARTEEMLKTEGFGVLCRIDIKDKLQEKLGVKFRDYVILGACNPPLAYQALQEEPALGLLLPCNVVVYENDGQSVVAAIDAVKMMSVVGNPRLTAVAGQVNEKLRRVIDNL